MKTWQGHRAETTGLGQGSAPEGPRAKSCPGPVFVNKDVLVHSTFEYGCFQATACRAERQQQSGPQTEPEELLPDSTENQFADPKLGSLGSGPELDAVTEPESWTLNSAMVCE